MCIRDSIRRVGAKDDDEESDIQKVVADAAANDPANNKSID